MESAIAGNDVQFKCNIQSYVADFVQVVAWVDSEGASFMLDQKYGNFLFDRLNQLLYIHGLFIQVTNIYQAYKDLK